ncbi:MAG: hypothetical protein MZV64_67915 [Ignavibacteriales bacterium]|nr:hypothetical protein [Ignavibacteriales bacterium]
MKVKLGVRMFRVVSGAGADRSSTRRGRRSSRGRIRRRTGAGSCWPSSGRARRPRPGRRPSRDHAKVRAISWSLLQLV